MNKKSTRVHPLYTFRETKGWTLQKLADELGISRQAVYQYEHFKNKPSAKAFYRIQQLFKKLRYQFNPEDYF